MKFEYDPGEQKGYTSLFCRHCKAVTPHVADFSKLSSPEDRAWVKFRLNPYDYHTLRWVCFRCNKRWLGIY